MKCYLSVAGRSDLEYKLNSKFFGDLYYFASGTRGLLLNFRHRVHEDPEEGKNAAPS